MQNIILISGRLEKNVFINLKREILLADKSKKITFIINSIGGHAESNLEFLDWFAEIKSQLSLTEVKIHVACSAAAMLALSLAESENRSITSTGKFSFHYGTLTQELYFLDNAEFNLTLKTRNIIKKHDQVLRYLFSKLKPSNKINFMALLVEFGKLDVSLEDCVEVGIVSRII